MFDFRVMNKLFLEICSLNEVVCVFYSRISSLLWEKIFLTVSRWFLTAQTHGKSAYRRAWVAPARDGRYVLGQLRSRTAGVSFLSFWDGVCRHNWNGPKFEKSRLF